MAEREEKARNVMEGRVREKARVLSWKQACRFTMKKQRASEGYLELLARVPSEASVQGDGALNETSGHEDGRWAGMCDADAEERRMMHFKQIDKDIGRTFPANPLFRKVTQDSDPPRGPGEAGQTVGQDGPLLRPLRRVLCAYSLRNPRIGYCQSMNFIVGTLLMVMEEEDAFWILSCIVEDYLPDYYTEDMHGLRVDLLVLQNLVVETFPKVHRKLQELELPLEIPATRWFLSLFTVVFDQSMILKILDKLFSSNSGCLFRVSMAFISKVQKRLLACQDAEEAMSILNNETGSRHEIKGLFKFSQFKFPRLEAYRSSARSKFPVQKVDKGNTPQVSQQVRQPSSSSWHDDGTHSMQAKAYHIPQTFLKGQNRIVMKILRLHSLPAVAPGRRLHGCILFLDPGEAPPMEDASLLQHPASSSVLLQTYSREAAASGDVHHVTDNHERDIMIVLFLCNDRDGEDFQLVGKARIRSRLGDLFPSMSLTLMDRSGRLLAMGPGRTASIDLFLSYSPLIEPEAETRPLPPAPRPFYNVHASDFSGQATSMQGHAAPEADEFLLRSQSSRRAGAVPSSSPAPQAPREDRARPAGALLAERAASSGRAPPPDRYDGRMYPPYAPQTYARPLYAPPPPGIFIRVNEPQPPLRHQYLPSSGQTWQTHRPINMSAGPSYPRTATVSAASPSFSTVAEPRPLQSSSSSIPYFTHQVTNGASWQAGGFSRSIGSSAAAMADPRGRRDVQQRTTGWI